MSSMSISITNVSASSLVHRTPMQFRRPTKKSTTRFPSSLRVSAHGHPHGHPQQQTTDPSAPPKFLDELRQYAMALHTKEQAPGSGTSCTGLEEDDTTTTRRRHDDDSNTLTRATTRFARQENKRHPKNRNRSSPPNPASSASSRNPKSSTTPSSPSSPATPATSACGTPDWSAGQPSPRTLNTWSPRGISPGQIPPPPPPPRRRPAASTRP